MIRVSVEEIASNLIRYIRRVEEGETLILLRSDRPIAELRPIKNQAPLSKRPFGLCAGEFIVPDDFDEPLPEEVLADFEGR